MIARTRRTGLSLLELIVVVAILAVLLALLLPAVQKVRLAAQRSREANKLRQLAIATHHFDAVYAALPDVRGYQPPTGRSVFLSLLAFLDGVSPDQSTSTDYYHHPYFRSDLDPSFDIPPLREDMGDCSYAVNTLAFPAGGGLARSFADGTSATIGLSSHYARCGRTSFSSSLVIYQCLDEGGRPVPCPAAGGRSATFADARSDDVLPVPAGPGRTVPSVPGMTFQLRPRVDECDARVPQAFFPTGLLVSLMDGSVRTVSAGVSEPTFWAAVTPAGGEVLGSDW